eukprot:403345808
MLAQEGFIGGASPDLRDQYQMLTTGNFYNSNTNQYGQPIAKNSQQKQSQINEDIVFNNLQSMNIQHLGGQNQNQNEYSDSDDSSYASSTDEEERLDRKKEEKIVQDGCDLDLTYVTPKIIAMGYPGERLEQFYRNSMKDVQDFFKKKHSGFYKIYNLCKERAYSDKCFEKTCQRFIFEDHNPPPFDMILQFCQDMEEFLKEDDRNVAAIHCKAGKGRTGVMICCYLIYAREFKSAHDALVFYGKIRTSNGKGVTIPSQIRYVYYFENFLQLKKQMYPQKNLTQMPRQVLKIYKIRMITIPQFQNGGIEPSFKVKFKDTTIYDYKQEGKTKFLSSLSYYDFRIKNHNLLVYDDVKIEFYNKNKLTQKKIFHFWFNTSFIDNSGVLSMDKPMIEKASKDKKCAVFDRNFRIEVYMSRIKNYEMEECFFDKDVVLELPVENFTEEQQQLLMMAENMPRLERKLSL